MGFALLVLLTANLFLRPAELIPQLRGLPLYEWNIIAAVVVALPALFRRMRTEELARDPITLCVLGLYISVPISHLRHFFIWGARHSTEEFSKTVLYYFLVVSLVHGRARFEVFLRWILFLLTVMVSLSLAHHHGVIYIPELDSIEQREYDAETGELLTFPRLQGTGIFNDPNDFAMVLVIGMVLAAHSTASAAFATRPIWFATIGAFGYALYLTKSRGGFLALFVGLCILAHARWGKWRALLIAGLLAPIVVAAFAMRQGGALDEGTGQSRIQLWSEGLGLMKHYPVFGIGQGMYTEELPQVAHNSFVHCYVELGLFGGTFFFGAFYLAVMILLRQRRDPEIQVVPNVRRQTVTTIAVLAAACTSMLSLSRSYVLTTYLVLGLAGVAAHLNGRRAPWTIPRPGARSMLRLAIASFGFLVSTYIFVRVMVRWS